MQEGYYWLFLSRVLTQLPLRLPTDSSGEAEGKKAFPETSATLT